jgi:glycosyltransferase involved in cell wall biosynthesis
MKNLLILLGYNRPDYFEKVAESVLDQEMQWETAVLVDGARSVNDVPLVNRTKEIAKRHFHEVVCNTQNQNMEKQWQKAYQIAFESGGYDRMLLVEDDLVLSPCYTTAIDDLLGLFNNDSRIGMVSAYNCRINNDPRALPGEDLVVGGHLWGVATWKDRWFQWKDYYDQFASIALQPDTIKDLYYSWGGVTGSSTVNDGALHIIMNKLGQMPVTTTNSYASYIGEFGEYGRREYYMERRFQEIPCFNQWTCPKPITDEWFLRYKKVLDDIYARKK